MKLYVDDLRNPPDDSWYVVRTAEEAIVILSSMCATHVSLDHDLGDNVPPGYDVLLWLEREIITNDYPMPEIIIHTANPSAKVKMDLCVKRLKERMTK